MTIGFFDQRDAARRAETFTNDPRPFLEQIGGTEPGLFSGAFSAPFIGTKHGLDLAASAVANTVSPWAEDALRRAVSEDAAEWLQRQTQKAEDSVRVTRADPRTMGLVAQIGHAVTSVLTEGAIGSVVAGPAGAVGAIGGLSGFDKFKELRDQGVDTETALKVSGITGATMGVGAALPPFIGATLARQIASGVGINVGLGLGERAGSASILESAGYDKVAEHYKALDKSALAIDAVLGAAFPVGARLLRKPTETPRVDETDLMQRGNEDVQRQLRGIDLPTTTQGVDGKLELEYEAARQLLVEDRPVSALELPKVNVESVANPTVADGASIAIKAINDLVAAEQGKPLVKLDEELTIAARAMGEQDAVQVRGAEEVDVREQAGDGEAVAARDTEGQEVAGTREAEKEVKPEDFTNQQARELADTMPDARVADDEGNVVTAKELMDRADAEFKMTEQESKLINVAVACAIGVGE